MKKITFLSMILCVSLLLQYVSVPVLATGET